MTYEFMTNDWVADAIVARFREGFLPDDEEAAFMDRRPLIDLLRAKILPTDVSTFLEVMDNENGPRAGLAVSLLRHHATDPQVKHAFTDRWETAEPFLRNRIMWRMLDDSALSSSWHKRFFDFVFSEWKTFSEFNRAFYGTGADGINNMLARVGDTSFPGSKKWVYVCSIPDGIVNYQAAKGVLTLCLSLNDELAQEAARRVLKFLDGDDPLPRKEDEIISSDESTHLGFIGDAIIAYLRKGQIPSDDELDALNQIPIVDIVRSEIVEDDFSWLLPVIENQSSPLAAYYLSLLQTFDTIDRIKKLLKRRWETADPYLRAHLMWRILDDPDLEEYWHRKILNFVLDEWEVFRDVVRKFLGESSAVISNVLGRMANSDYPDSKKWINLCRLPEIAGDQKAAKAIIQLSYKPMPQFNQEVAVTLMERFYPEG